MAILNDRAVHIHVDWILDLRHNIKFRLVVVLLNMHNDSILVTMLLRDSN